MEHALTVEERAARYEMALRAIRAISNPTGDVRRIVDVALNVLAVVMPDDEKPKWSGTRR